MLALTDDEIAATAKLGRRMFSNGTEYEIWSARNCETCVHDSIGAPTPEPEIFCPILGAILRGHWPSQVPVEPATEKRPYEQAGKCEKYEERDDDNWPPPPPPPPSPPEVAGQLPLILIEVEA